MLKVGYVLCRAVLWQAPKYAFGFAGRSYAKLPPPRRSLVKIGGGVILVMLSAASLTWYVVLSTPAMSGPNVPSANPDAEEEVCEFFGRPAFSLYIDGRLVSKEIPPLYRTVLSVGEHTVRFVSPSGTTRETTIRVLKGRPTQWFMSFVDGRLHRRAPISAVK